LVAKLILYRSAESIIRKEKMPAYRANIAAYLLARLSASEKLDLSAIWARQSPSPALEQTIRDWTPRIYDCLVSTAAGRNVTEWCKKPDCWAAIQRLPLPAPTASA
jgi:hypothetical protein